MDFNGAIFYMSGFGQPEAICTVYKNNKNNSCDKIVCNRSTGRVADIIYSALSRQHFAGNIHVGPYEFCIKVDNFHTTHSDAMKNSDKDFARAATFRGTNLMLPSCTHLLLTYSSRTCCCVHKTHLVITFSTRT